LTGGRRARPPSTGFHCYLSRCGGWVCRDAGGTWRGPSVRAGRSAHCCPRAAGGHGRRAFALVVRARVEGHRGRTDTWRVQLQPRRNLSSKAGLLGRGFSGFVVCQALFPPFPICRDLHHFVDRDEGYVNVSRLCLNDVPLILQSIFNPFTKSWCSSIFDNL
jgi:hypothetical protein